MAWRTMRGAPTNTDAHNHTAVKQALARREGLLKQVTQVPPILGQIFFFVVSFNTTLSNMLSNMRNLTIINLNFLLFYIFSTVTSTRYPNYF